MLPDWLRRRDTGKAALVQAEFEALLADHASLLEAAAKTLELLANLSVLGEQTSHRIQDIYDGSLRELTLLHERVESLAIGWKHEALRREAANCEELASVHTRLELLSNEYGSKLERLESRLNEEHEFNLERLRRLGAEVRSNPADFGLINPEAGLMSHLYSYLPVGTAIDVGAHNGAVSERLLNAGYEVYAFEPYPPVFNQLMARLGGRSIKAYNLALGSSDTVMKLHIAQDRSSDGKYKDPTQLSSLLRHPMPEDLPFVDSIDVNLRSLESLAAEGLVPRSPGLVKIDTEGYDLEVIKGLGSVSPQVLVCEYWAEDFIFGQGDQYNRLDELVQAARTRDYRWYLVLYRTAGSERVSYYCNYDKAVANSWGNVIFFRDREVFLQAMQWCSAVLPTTYFNDIAAASHSPLSASEVAPSPAPLPNGLDVHRRPLADGLGANGARMNGLNARLDQLNKLISLKGEEIGLLREEAKARERSLITAIGRLEARLGAAKPEMPSWTFAEETGSFKKQVEELRQIVREREFSIDRLQDRLRRMKRSYSWKMTSPLREIRRAGVRIGSYVTGRDFNSNES